MEVLCPAGNVYEKDGQTHFTTDVIVEAHYFCGNPVAENRAGEIPDDGEEGFMDIPEYIDDEVPFR